MKRHAQGSKKDCHKSIAEGKDVRYIHKVLLGRWGPEHQQ